MMGKLANNSNSNNGNPNSANPTMNLSGNNKVFNQTQFINSNANPMINVVNSNANVNLNPLNNYAIGNFNLRRDSLGLNRGDPNNLSMSTPMNPSNTLRHDSINSSSFPANFGPQRTRSDSIYLPPPIDSLNNHNYSRSNSIFSLLINFPNSNSNSFSDSVKKKEGYDMDDSNNNTSTVNSSLNPTQKISSVDQTGRFSLDNINQNKFGSIDMSMWNDFNNQIYSGGSTGSINELLSGMINNGSIDFSNMPQDQRRDSILKLLNERRISDDQRLSNNPTKLREDIFDRRLSQQPKISHSHSKSDSLKLDQPIKEESQSPKTSPYDGKNSNHSIASNGKKNGVNGTSSNIKNNRGQTSTASSQLQFSENLENQPFQTSDGNQPFHGELPQPYQSTQRFYNPNYGNYQQFSAVPPSSIIREQRIVPQQNQKQQLQAHVLSQEQPQSPTQLQTQQSPSNQLPEFQTGYYQSTNKRKRQESDFEFSGSNSNIVSPEEVTKKKLVPAQQIKVSEDGRPLLGATKIDQLMLVIQAREKGVTDQIQQAPDGSILGPEAKDSNYEILPRPDTLVGGVDKPKPHDEVEDEELKKKNKSQQCQYCLKYFTQSTHLEVHIRSHIGFKPFECNFCHKKFTQGGNLRTHLRLHTGEKPFTCDICNRSFSRKGNLAAHRLTHENLKPFECRLDNCDKSFTQLGNLKSHQNRFHLATLNDLTHRLAELSGDALQRLPPHEKELLNYFKELYKNSNKGIRGRGKSKQSTNQKSQLSESPPNQVIPTEKGQYNLQQSKRTDQSSPRQQLHMEQDLQQLFLPQSPPLQRELQQQQQINQEQLDYLGFRDSPVNANSFKQRGL